MRNLTGISKYILAGSASLLSDDGRMVTELLWEIVQRLDYVMSTAISDIEVLDHVERKTITTTETRIYQNNSPNIVTVKIYNIDPAQTVYVGKRGITILNASIPVFHESHQRISIAPGETCYGIVAAGTGDIRLSVNMTQ